MSMGVNMSGDGYVHGVCPRVVPPGIPRDAVSKEASS